MSGRSLRLVIAAVPTRDGAGVRLRRTLGQSPEARLDPFLLLDEFSSHRADDYIAGFPAHPHRGFETVTYMLDGDLLHEDHLGNRAELHAGDVQWMTAGRGIIHSEMPRQRQGRLRGFQLWLNLAARDKMNPAVYRDIPAGQMPWHDFGEGIRVKSIAGILELRGRRLAGPIQAPITEPLYADLTLAAKASLSLPLPGSHNALVYLFEGDAEIAGEPVHSPAAALLGGDGPVGLRAGAAGARLLLLAGRPLGEPVAQYGPLVMNTPAEIEQALQDYRNGTLTG